MFFIVTWEIRMNCGELYRLDSVLRVFYGYGEHSELCKPAAVFSTVCNFELNASADKCELEICSYSEFFGKSEFAEIKILVLVSVHPPFNNM